jgi:hypothetical protein
VKIEGVTSAYYRLPLEPMGDAGHGAIDSEEIITVKLRADGLEGHGYAYTIGRGGRAVRALIEHDLAPLLAGRDATDIAALWELMWQRLLYVGRGGLASFAIAAVDIALWDLRGLSKRAPLYRLFGAAQKEIPAYGSGVDLPKPLNELLSQTETFLKRGLPGVKVKIGKRDAREDEERIAAVRDLIGDRIDLMVDAGWYGTDHPVAEPGRPDPKRGVEPSTQVLERDHQRELHHLGVAEMPTQGRNELVGHVHRSPAHARGEVQHQLLDLGEPWAGLVGRECQDLLVIQAPPASNTGPEVDAVFAVGDRGRLELSQRPDPVIEGTGSGHHLLQLAVGPQQPGKVTKHLDGVHHPAAGNCADQGSRALLDAFLDSFYCFSSMIAGEIRIG